MASHRRVWPYSFMYLHVAVNGGFSDFDACSKTCGDGIQTRTCTEPAPAFGGADCVGDKTKACNLAECPYGKDNLRCGLTENQCDYIS